MKIKKLFVGICNSQNVIYSDFFWSIMRLKVNSPVAFIRAIHPWDVIRNNQLIDQFLKSDFDYFVKMDVDQIYPDDYFIKMIPLVEEHKIIGPLIFDRWSAGNFLPLINWADKEPYDLRGKTGIIEVPYLHTNCFFHRKALEALAPPYYEANLSSDGLKRANHVDITFMKKFVMAGFKIYANLDVVVNHIAEVPVDRETYERWNY